MWRHDHAAVQKRKNQQNQKKSHVVDHQHRLSGGKSLYVGRLMRNSRDNKNGMNSRSHPLFDDVRKVTEEETLSVLLDIYHVKS